METAFFISFSSRIPMKLLLDLEILLPSLWLIIAWDTLFLQRENRGSRDRCLDLSDEVLYFPNRSEISLEAENAIFLLRMNNYHKSAISILSMEPFDDSLILSQSVSRNRPKDP